MSINIIQIKIDISSTDRQHFDTSINFDNSVPQEKDNIESNLKICFEESSLNFRHITSPK